MFKVGQPVKIIPANGPSTWGHIHSEIEMMGSIYFWVEYYLDGGTGQREIDPYSLDQLLQWNPHRKIEKCDCGSEKLQHPGHSAWCSKINS